MNSIKLPFINHPSFYLNIMPPRIKNEKRDRGQLEPLPVKENPLNNYVSHAKFRAAFTVLAHSIAA